MLSMIDTEVSTRNTPQQCIHVQRKQAHAYTYTHTRLIKNKTRWWKQKWANPNKYVLVLGRLYVIHVSFTQTRSRVCVYRVGWMRVSACMCGFTQRSLMILFLLHVIFTKQIHRVCYVVFYPFYVYTICCVVGVSTQNVFKMYNLNNVIFNHVVLYTICSCIRVHCIWVSKLVCVCIGKTSFTCTSYCKDSLCSYSTVLAPYS